MPEKFEGGTPPQEFKEGEKEGLIGYKEWGGPYRGSRADAERLAKKIPGGRVTRLRGSIEIQGQFEAAYGVAAPFKPIEGFDVWNPEVTEEEHNNEEE